MEALQIVVITVNCARWKTDKKGAASSASDPIPRRGAFPSDGIQQAQQSVQEIMKIRSDHEFRIF